MGSGRLVVAVILGVSGLAWSSPAPVATPRDPDPLPAAAVPETETVDRRELARRALAHFDAKRYAEAVEGLTLAAREYPEVAPFLRLRIVEAEIARGNFAEAASTASEIIALGETSAVTIARLRLPAIYARLGEREETDAAWRQAMQVPIDELTEARFVDLAKELAQHGRADLAKSTRLRLLNDYTQGRFTEQTYGHLRADIARMTTAEQIAIAAKLARANRYDQALEILNRVGDVEGARTTRLRALFNSRHYTRLLDETSSVTFTDPALVLLRARAAWRAGQPQQFLDGLARLEKEFASSREAAEAKVLRAKYYVTDEVDYARSVENLRKAIAAGAVGNDGENIWNLGYTYVLWGKYDEALREFDRYIAAYPDGDWKTNSLFWSAKIFDRLGRTAERDARARQIVDEFPFSYYAYRVRELWNATPSTPAKPQTAFPDVSAALAEIDAARLNTVRELLDIGLARDATREMQLVAAAHPENAGAQFMLADVYVRGGEPFKANSLLQRRFRQFIRHGGTNIPRRFWEILYPLAYWETIQAEAQRRSLDPYLIASITRQESGFEPTVVSNAGAVGLMQIMPEEAPRIAAAGGLGEITRESLFDPRTNIAVGVAEFSQKLAAMDGQRNLAIAAYNAGERPVREWMQRTPLDDMDLFVESIPYAETRLYVKTVNRNRHEYRRIYEAAASAP